MVCPYLDDLWELYLLGALGADEANAASDHLATGCAHCLEQLREATLTVFLLTRPARTVRPDPKSKSNLLLRLQRR